MEQQPVATVAYTSYVPTTGLAGQAHALGVSPALRPYQDECVTAIDQGWGEHIRRQLITLPTGAGKTVVFAHQIAHQPGRSIVLVHRDELVVQTIEKLVAAGADPAAIGVVKAERNEVGAHIVVASIQTLSRPTRLAHLVPDFATVVVDEAHHARARSYMRVLTYFGCFREDGPLLLGFTATPDRADGSSIAEVFEACVFSRSTLELMNQDYLCDARALTIHARALDLAAVHTRQGDFCVGELETALLRANAPNLVLNAYQEHAEGRKGLVFTPTVSLAAATTERFREAGIAAELLTGGTPLGERHAMLERFRAGVTRVLCNCAVLCEGYDDPTVEVIIIARPTKSRALFAQMVGRGLRLHPGKTDCVVIDVAGNAGRHDIASVPDIFGLPARDLPPGTSVRAAHAAKLQAEADRAAELEAQRVELFARARAAQATEEAERWPSSVYAWLPVGRRSGALTLPDGFLAVRPLAEGWELVAVRGGRPVVLGTFGRRVLAVRAAESKMRETGGVGLALRGTRWRCAPPSAALLGRCRARGILATAGETAGDLSGALLCQEATRFLRAWTRDERAG
jgi:superfamily II DNA or RNA helicase